MKPSQVVLMLSITLLMFACNWFKKNNDYDAKKLVGKWGFVQVGDTTKKVDSTVFASVDSVASIEFNKDSSYSLYTATGPEDAGTYYFDSTKQTLFIKADTAYIPLQIKYQSDSTIELVFMNDSVHYVLKKQ